MGGHLVIIQLMPWTYSIYIYVRAVLKTDVSMTKIDIDDVIIVVMITMLK